MKKIMTKIVGAFLGVAMTIGVAFAVGNKANAVYAEEESAYTITFANNASSATAISSSTNASTAIASSSTSYVESKPFTVNSGNVYYGDTKTCIRLGKSGNNASLTIALSDTGKVNATKFVVNCMKMSGNKNANATLSVNGMTAQAAPASADNLTFTFANTTSIETINLSSVTALYVYSIEVYKEKSGGQQNPTTLGNPNPQYDDLDKIVSWTKDTHATKYQFKVDSGSYEDITTPTFDARNLSVGNEHTVYIKAVGDGTNYLDSEASVKFTPTIYEVHRKFTVTGKSSVTGTGDLITGSTASFSQTANNLFQITADNTMTLSITGLTKKVTISKLVLSMHSNKSTGSGSIYVKTDSNDASYIAGTADGGVSFNQIGDNTKYSENDYVDVTWAGLNYLAKSSIEIKITGTANSLYCQSFLIFFSEEENNDYVSELTVSPASWTGYETNLLQVEDFTVSVTTGGVAGSAVDYEFLGIGYMDGNNFVARDANFIYGYPTTADTRLAWKANYPTTVGGSEYLYAYVTLNVSADTISSIEISGNMTKTTYFTNDEWMYYGLTAEAVYASGNRINVTGSATYQYYSDSAMTNEVATPEALGAGENQKLYVKATYEGISNTVGYEQTVSLSVEHGSLITDPLTVDEAVAMGKELQYATAKEYYIRGIITQIDTSSSHTNDTCATFFLEESDEIYDFEAFKVKYDANCTNHDDLVVGAEVLIKCQLRRYTAEGKHLVENGNDNGVLLSISFTKPALESITLNKTELCLAVGEDYTLTASAYPLGADLDTVVWSTLNNSVATVDQNGVVTAVGLGSATITATSGDISAACKVTVAALREIDLTIDETTSASDDALSWNYADEFEIVAATGTGTKVTNYYPGTPNKSYTVTRFYNGNTITVTPDSKTNVLKVLFSAASESAATKLAASSYTNASAVASNKTVIITVTNPSLPFSIGVEDKCDFNGIKVYYQEATAKELVERLNTQTELAYRYEKDGEGNFTYSDIVMRFGGQVSKDLWNELDTNEHNITGFGVILMNGDLVKSMADVVDAMTDMALSTVSKSLDDYMAIDYFVPIANMNETIGSDDNNYFWNLRVSVAQSEMNKAYAAVAYIKLGDEYVLLNMANESVETLALDYMVNRGCDDTTAGGSLQNIIAKAA